MRKTTRLFLVLAVLFLIASCHHKQKDSDLQNFIANLKKQPVKIHKFIDDFHFLKAQNYVQTDIKRNPFPESSDTSFSITKAASPLEQYPLDTFHLLGTIQQGIKSTAVVSTPDNKIFQVTIGERLGNSQGTIEQITDGQMTVIEPANASMGRASPRIITLQLKEQ